VYIELVDPIDKSYSTQNSGEMNDQWIYSNKFYATNH